ncbi:hypothetical protein PAPYR_9276 [Paratrimastix pyriformis]|uniref:Uncharacterized protein n=1 Tax=Paratrimastix pyriformis TaxID=342808 RepID=A0ABQ8UCX2_9EUKA|nr:hypothetical protein PAPYR_9276 [Paratrimastix pyriformis]
MMMEYPCVLPDLYCRVKLSVADAIPGLGPLTDIAVDVPPILDQLVPAALHGAPRLDSLRAADRPINVSYPKFFTNFPTVIQPSQGWHALSLFRRGGVFVFFSTYALNGFTRSFNESINWILDWTDMSSFDAGFKRCSHRSFPFCVTHALQRILRQNVLKVAPQDQQQQQQQQATPLDPDHTLLQTAKKELVLRILPSPAQPRRELRVEVLPRTRHRPSPFS